MRASHFPGGKITLLETAPGVSAAEVIAATEADLFIHNNVPEMKM
jgi:acetate CoA/acetoacetate CoA-transferase beta subunit